ncbi:hypothetical protein [Sedimentitalea sp.]|uniref:hypothetical protein n=1 Tax=Sedimentitalea sp. TaxID=2048915 RepID=UPI003296994F
MQRTGLNRSKLFVVLALICALAGSGFAHRIAAPLTDPSLATYVQAGGSIADLCGDFGGQSHDVINNCEACRLANSAVLAEHDAVAIAVFGKRTTLDVLQHQSHPETARLDLSRPVRGPPVS